MSDKIYIVYATDWHCIGEFDWDETIIDEKYFTTEEQAELYAEYCELKNRIENKYRGFNYHVLDLECGDYDRYPQLIDDIKKQIELKEEADKLENKRRKLRNYALDKSRIEGGDWMKIYHDLLKENGLDD